MQTYLPAVLSGLASALVVVSGYHLLIAGPRLAQLRAIVLTHDGLLGGGTPGAVDRLAALERQSSEIVAARDAEIQRVAALEKMAQVEVPRVGFVRFNAFSDVGSDLSYALALLNRDGDGVVLSSIYSREDTRTYGKSVTAFKPAQDPSSEELAAIEKARTAAA